MQKIPSVILILKKEKKTIYFHFIILPFINFTMFSFSFSDQDHCTREQWSVLGNERRQAESSDARVFRWATTKMGIPELRSYKGITKILTKRNLGFFFFTRCWVYQSTSLSVPVLQFFSIVKRSSFSLPGYYSWTKATLTHCGVFGIVTYAFSFKTKCLWF